MLKSSLSRTLISSHSCQYGHIPFHFKVLIKDYIAKNGLQSYLKTELHGHLIYVPCQGAMNLLKLLSSGFLDNSSFQILLIMSGISFWPFKNFLRIR